MIPRNSPIAKPIRQPRALPIVYPKIPPQIVQRIIATTKKKVIADANLSLNHSIIKKLLWILSSTPKKMSEDLPY